MPSSPKIQKETMLEHALKIVIRDGYAALSITGLAREIGCSTQPISWHFQNMEGLRTELGKYALQYANHKLSPASSGIQAFTEVGHTYIDIAFDEPKLFRYLYMSADSGQFVDSFGFDTLIAEKDNAALVDVLAAHLNITADKAGAFCKNMMVYTHGLASYIAAGIIVATKQDVHEMMKAAWDAFFKQIKEASR